MNDNEEPITSWTLAAIKAQGLALEGYCQSQGCGRFYAFDLDGLIETAGADYVVPEILPGIACVVCGGQLEFKLAVIRPHE